MAKIMRHVYTLEKINEILYQGFEYKLPDETLGLISKIASEVGSPDYIKTPVFEKRENPMKDEPTVFTKEYSILILNLLYLDSKRIHLFMVYLIKVN